MAADLHIHTTASDGFLSPEETVNQAIYAGLTHIALTDHDTVNGLLSLQKAGHTSNGKISIIPGIEFSTDLPQHEVHILGYFIDIFNNELRHELEIITTSRFKRLERIISRLKKLGYHVDYQHVLEIAGQAKSIGRPHVARALIEKGYFTNINDVFSSLLEKNRPAYVPHYKLTPQKAITLIKRAGGMPVLAHPGLIGNDNILTAIIRLGICGLEVYHPKHDLLKTKRYMEIACQHNLAITGGSDFHAIPDRFPDKLGLFTIDSTLAYKLCQLHRFGHA